MKKPATKTPAKLAPKAMAKAQGPAKNSPVTTSSIDRKYEVEDAMRTLMRADELRKDGKLMSDVQKHAAAQAAKMSSICKTAK